MQSNSQPIGNQPGHFRPRSKQPPMQSPDSVPEKSSTANPTNPMTAPLKTALLILTMAIASSSCQRSSTHHTSGSEPDTSAAAPTARTEPGEPAKWPMPEAMMKHLRDLEQDVRNLDAAAEKDHAALAAKIDGHTDRLIANCTMDGKAHDALHDWLMPFLQLNKAYATAPDAAAQSSEFQKIKDALATFHERFE